MPRTSIPPPPPDELSRLHTRVARLEMIARWRGRALAITSGALLVLGGAAAFGGIGVQRQLESCRAKLVESRQAHSALARAEGDAMPARRVVGPAGTQRAIGM